MEEKNVPEHVDSNPGREDVGGPPPPVVVLGAQQEVGEDDGHLAGGDGEDQEHNEQKAEQIVEVVLPDGRQHEVEL